jgi:hypothetical protein
MGGSPDINFPQQPDPANLAAQQGQNNLEAAIATSLLNQYNEVTPFGTVTYTSTPRQGYTGGGGGQYVDPRSLPGYMPGLGSPRAPGEYGLVRTADGRWRQGGGAGAVAGSTASNLLSDLPQFTRTVTLNPEAQAQLEAQQAIGMNLSNLAQENIGRVRGAQQAGLSFEGLPGLVSDINAAPISGFMAPGQEVRSTLQRFDPLQGIDTSFLQAQPSLMDLVPDRAPAPFPNIPEPVPLETDFAEQGAALEQATFERARSLLEPEFERQRQQAEVRLSERGLPLGSQISNDLLGGIESARGRTLNELALSSVMAGRQEQERLARLGLDYGREQFGQRMQRGMFGLERAGQQFGQDLQRGQLGLQAAGQQFGQGLQGAQFGADLAQQQFLQGLGQAEFENAAQQQAFGQAQAAQSAQNLAQQQSFDQAMQRAALAQQARQQGIQERSYVRNLPLNDIATLLGTSPGIQAPQFTAPAQVGVQAGDLIGATLGVNNQLLQQAQMQQQARSGLLGGLMSLGGSLGSAAIMSDIRMKDNIKRVGKYRDHALYSYNYKGSADRVLGVMAQEVEKTHPQAVIEIGGIKHVNYGAL